MSEPRFPDGTPQYADTCERELIGAALLTEAADVLAVSLDASAFRSPALGTIWAAVQRAAADGNPGVVNTAWHLDQAGKLDEVGAETGLVHLAGRAFVEQPFPHLAMLTHPPIVREWAARRAALRDAQGQARRAINGPIRQARGGVAI